MKNLVAIIALAFNRVADENHQRKLTCLTTKTIIMPTIKIGWSLDNVCMHKRVYSHLPPIEFENLWFYAVKLDGKAHLYRPVL